jgi:predicted hydrocarbon binding protein
MLTADQAAPGVRRAPDEPLMRGNFFAATSYLQTDVAKGTTRNRAGTRIVCLTADFLTGFRRAIEHECGPAAEAVFKTCGRKWGEASARRFDQELSEFYGKPVRDFPLALFTACLTELFSHHGWGRPALDLSRHAQGLLVIELQDPIGAALAGKAERPADTLLAGLLAGFFGHFSGEDLDCVQTRCKACGDPASTFVVGLRPRLAPAAAWVEAGRPHEQILADLLEVRA